MQEWEYEREEMYSLGHAQSDFAQMVDLETYQGIAIQSYQACMYQCHLTTPSDQLQFTVDHTDRSKSQRDQIKTSVC